MDPNDSNTFFESDGEIRSRFINLQNQVDIYQGIEDSRKKTQDHLNGIVLDALHSYSEGQREEIVVNLRNTIKNEFAWMSEHENFYMKNLFGERPNQTASARSSSLLRIFSTGSRSETGTTASTSSSWRSTTRATRMSSTRNTKRR